ncbi:hypothetical protein [Paracnuella aquatica]|uniref:hypothetical protein n=1 Tax=Paracnuella aquatica TaxID=2268757 RepID=UPI000DEFFEAD|nr:hypothetical protein [Paracnuella aquatica]RPD46705.1 hypothetical protein DRJ53_13280 [Paracnuella aquatica]
MNTKYFLAGSLFIALGLGAQAQDTTRKREVSVTSTFKPELREAAKINFNAAPPTADTTRPRLQYTIPNQNLSLAFQPGSLKPMALQVDTGGRFDGHNYAKLGFGNLSTPYAQVGLSLGDGKTSGLNLYGSHVSSKGKRPFQKFSNTEVEANAFLQNARNGEWQARIGTVQDRYNRYGFQPDTLKFPEDSLRVKYATIRGRLAYRNLEPTKYGLNYAPEIRIDIFNDGLSNSESNTYLYLPLSKNISNRFTAKLAAETNLTRYKPEGKDAVSNNYFLLAPELRFHNANVQVQAGIKPAWEGGGFKVLPNVTAEFGIASKGFTVQLGWLGYFRSSGFQYLANFNPWIWAPDTVYNTRIEERYVGVKGSVGDHFSYNVRAGSNRLNNQPLFVNDTASGKSFQVLNESKMTNVYIAGEMGYTWGERVSFNTMLRLNNFSGLRDNDKAWGLLPMEFTSRLRVQILKDLYATADMFAFEGARYLTKGGDGRRQKGAVDLNAGMEFGIAKNIKLWAQFNNIFGKEYQRWNQYPVYGFNFLGGVVFSFAQNGNK